METVQGRFLDRVQVVVECLQVYSAAEEGGGGGSCHGSIDWMLLQGDFDVEGMQERECVENADPVPIPRWGSSLLEGVRSPRHKFPRSIIFVVSALSLRSFVFTFHLCSYPLLLTPQYYFFVMSDSIGHDHSHPRLVYKPCFIYSNTSSVPTSLRTLLSMAIQRPSETRRNVNHILLPSQTEMRS